MRILDSRGLLKRTHGGVRK
ncbi:hypothetical protein [Hungatella hathewayi]